MYVTLEPCAHQGRQPPCTEAILEAGIARVVIGSDDPTEKAAGRGPGILRDGGVEVEFAAGAEATAARLLNQPFRKHARTGLPLVTLKLAMSLDGRDRDRSRRLALDLRRARAASWSTAGGPNPTRSRSGSAPSSPTTRCSPPATDGDPRQPLRVVFDRSTRLPLDSQLLRTLDESPVLVVASPDAPPTRDALREAGAEVLVVTDRDRAALSELGRRGITSLFLEGGRDARRRLRGGRRDRRGARSSSPRSCSAAGRAGARCGSGRRARIADAARQTGLSTEVETVGEDVLDLDPLQGVVTCSPA